MRDKCVHCLARCSAFCFLTASGSTRTAMQLDHLSNEQLAAIAGVKLLGRPRSTAEAGALLGLKPNTLEIKRVHGGGPPFIQAVKRGRVTYSERDLLVWLISSRRRNTSQAHPQLEAV